MEFAFRALSAALAVALTVFFAPPSWAQVTLQTKCEASKLASARKYGVCRLKAEAKGVVKNVPPNFSKCEERFSLDFGKAELKAGLGVCPTEMDQLPIDAAIAVHTAALASALSGGTALSFCGNGTQETGEQCDQGDFAGATCAFLGFPPGPVALACTSACQLDVSGCAVGSLVPGNDPILPKTGLTACFGPSGVVTPCTGTGQDGEIQAGQAQSFKNNGDGTISDDTTGLMWEVKCAGSSCPALNRVDAKYTWGDAFTKHVATLNSTNFAGHNDWRVANFLEVQTLWDTRGGTNVSVPRTFSPFANCQADCSLTSCSCTLADLYWSATEAGSAPTSAGVSAWAVHFVRGPESSLQTATNAVRAVRGGL